MGPFDPLTAGEREILARTANLPGSRIADLSRLALGEDPVSTKGYVGAAVEAFFDIDPNSRREADFPVAGIELKVAPIVLRGGRYSMKERTVISMIDYRSILHETWATASVRKKLRILFVFYEHRDDVPKSEFVILRTHLWQPEGQVEQLIRQDWEGVRRLVAEGRAHTLSESDGQLMGPCTKGPHSRHLVAQPVTTFSPAAKPRAFALKPTFVTALYHGARGATDAIGTLLEGMRLDDPDAFERELLGRFDRYVGRTVGDVAAQLRVPPSTAKNFAARVVRTAFGARDETSDHEFSAAGVTLRMARVSPDGQPYESMSFPAFDYFALLEEGWEDSDLLARVEQMLIVPIVGPRKDTPQEECRFGPPVLWRPTAEVLDTIRAEWDMYRREISEGRAAELTPASATRIIHVRPHSRDSRDTLPAPKVGPLVKKSFWINRSYVREILARR